MIEKEALNVMTQAREDAGQALDWRGGRKNDKQKNFGCMLRK